MQALSIINNVIMIVFLICYSYQFIYIPITWYYKSLAHRRTMPHNRSARHSSEPYSSQSGNLSESHDVHTNSVTPLAQSRHHSYAVMICARNEEAVIGDLIESIHNQTYPSELIQIYVMADNCTDHTALIARREGAIVYTRTNTELVGKGYAMEELMRYIRMDCKDGYDGYFVFDADNILAQDYIEQMDRKFAEGHDIITSYRNSKNYGDNWISAGYGLYFMRENRYLNDTRDHLGTSCTVSGTGYMFSRQVADALDGWPFHTLTEDLEFTADQIIHGKKIAFCDSAVFYDEQPTSFRQSWNQRMRWAKGYLQVAHKYGKELIRNTIHGSFSAFDMAMSIMPAFFLTVFSIVCNLLMIAIGIYQGDSLRIALTSLITLFGEAYLTLLFVGATVICSEWKRIHTSPMKKVLYGFTFPIFMFTYIPIAVISLFAKPSWKPIRHTRSMAKMEPETYHILRKVS